MAADVINGCEDLLKFVTVRRVTGGAVWRGEKLGKVVRFYYSTGFGTEQIEYATNSNKVPKSDGARPAMDMPDVFPDDVDKQRYIEIARKAMVGIGA